MKHVSLAVLATLALVGATACQDAVTSPQLGPELRYGQSSTPPPPPEDQNARGFFSPTSTAAFPIGTTQACGFTVPVRFLYNPKENNGWVHFENSDNGVIASSNGMVTYKRGDFSGKGTLEILVEGCGLIVIDLTSVNDANSFFCQGNQNCWELFFDVAREYPCGNTTDCDPIEGTANIQGGDFEQIG